MKLISSDGEHPDGIGAGASRPFRSRNNLPVAAAQNGSLFIFSNGSYPDAGNLLAECSTKSDGHGHRPRGPAHFGSKILPVRDSGSRETPPDRSGTIQYLARQAAPPCQRMTY